ncbi:hypothetical protein SOVF_077460 isoform B [Spinacia oleracea]|nr:hypothetical protein SOVF_077460 isoform B [Spinacia oleracea]
MAEIGYSVCSKLIEVMGKDCRSLKELPKDFCKLVKLRHLELQGCHDLIGMSFGMDKLTSLRILPNIVVGRKEQSVDDELKALKGLTEIKGSIDITIYSKYRRVEGMNGTGGGAGYLKSMKHLTGVNITFDEGGCVNPEAVYLKSMKHLTRVIIIFDYKDLTSFPSCPSLEELELKENNEALQIIVKITTTRGKEEKEEDKNAGVGNSQDDDNVKLWKVEIDNLGYLKSLPTNCLTHLDLTISDSKEGEGEWEVGDAFQKCVSSLRSLTIIGNHGINKVKRLSGRTGLEHFTLLESLKLSDIEDQEDEGEDNIIFWKSFPQNLRSLRIKDSDKMTSLPMGMQLYGSNSHLLNTSLILNAANLQNMDWCKHGNMLTLYQIDWSLDLVSPEAIPGHLLGTVNKAAL